MNGKRLEKLVVVVTVSIFLVFMTACNADELEIKTSIDVPQKTTTVTLNEAEPTNTCRAEQYDMDLKLDVEKKQLSGKVTLRLTNETKDILNELCIRTDAAFNMHIKNPIIVETNEQLKLKSKNEISSVYLDISNVPLQPNETLSLQFDFVTEIPKQKDRFGYTVNGNDEIYQLTFCYPRIAMYENGVWDESPYTDGAENNYVTVSDYNVNFEAPKDFTVIASGNEKTDGAITKISGENLRQLAIFAGTNIKKDTEIINDIEINNYYFNHKGNKEYYNMALEAAKDSINLFTNLIGAYPYKELDIVHGYYSSAMEYSSIILIGMPDVEDTTELDKNAAFTALSSRVAHEVAHQWFYGVVGNNPYDEPWLDEALAEYCEDILYQQSKLPSIATSVKHDKKFKGTSVWGTMSDDEFNQEIDNMINQKTEGHYIINKPYNAYDVENQEYSEYVYKSGSYFFYELRKAMGDGVFFPMLQEYYKAYYFNECSTEDFVNVILEFDNSEEVNKIIKKYIHLYSS